MSSGTSTMEYRRVDINNLIPSDRRGPSSESLAARLRLCVRRYRRCIRYRLSNSWMIWSVMLPRG